MSSRTKTISVSRSLIEAWIETGLRQLREIQEGEDILALKIIGAGPWNDDLIDIVYTTKTSEPDMEVYVFK